MVFHQRPAQVWLITMKRSQICSLTLNPAIDRTIFVDGFQLDTVNRSSEECVSPGSKGVNVAQTLAKTGIPTVCFGLIGGEGGQYIIEELTKSGVKPDFVEVGYDVRRNVKIVDLAESTYTDINFDGCIPPSESIRALKRKTAQLAIHSSLMALGGSVPPGVEDSIYCELAALANASGAKVSIDCCGKALACAFDAKPFIIKPNLFELESTLGIQCPTIDDVADAAYGLYQRGIENVLVSLGGDGALAVCSGDVFRLFTDDLPVYNTVGAGDAFLSGFIFGWSQGLDVLDCLKYALSFSQARVSLKAGDEFSLSDLTAYTKTAKVELLFERGVGDVL